MSSNALRFVALKFAQASESIKKSIKHRPREMKEFNPLYLILPSFLIDRLDKEFVHDEIY